MPFQNVRIVHAIAAIVSARGRDAQNAHRELLDFVLPMAVGEDVRFQVAIKGLGTNFSVPLTGVVNDVRERVAPSPR